MYANLPTNGSVAILNANAANGSLSSAFLSASSPSKVVPLTAGISNGDGKKSTTPSIISWTPLFLYEDPQIHGTISLAIVAFLNAIFNSSIEISSPSRYFSINVSSVSAIDSIIAALYSSAWSAKSAGIASSLISFPRSS